MSSYKKKKRPRLGLTLAAFVLLLGTSGCLRVVTASHLENLRASVSQVDLLECEVDLAIAEADLAECQRLGNRVLPHVE